MIHQFFVNIAVHVLNAPGFQAQTVVRVYNGGLVLVCRNGDDEKVLPAEKSAIYYK
jgi:hypothetical protein